MARIWNEGDGGGGKRRERTRATSMLLWACLIFVAIFAGSASGDEAPKVISVLSIDTAGDLKGFLVFAKRAREISSKHGSRGVQRVRQAGLAGDGVGSVFVGVEYPSLVAYAQDTSKVNATPEWQAFVADFQKSGMRVVSASLSTEVTP
jgi:hypothetical protein